MDAYSTHLPILEDLLKNNKINKVFEFGTGLYSTKLFSEKAQKVIACEMQDESWHQRVQQEFAACDNVEVKCMMGPSEAIEHLRNLGENFDLIFVDGHGSSRWDAINTAASYTNIIVSHDTETASYRWDLVNLDDSWERTDYTEHTPWTTVWRRR